MKTNKAAYLSIFFLACFVGSFSLSTFFVNQSSSSKDSSNTNKSVSVSQKADGHSSSSDSFFEEKENETENESILSPVILSFFTFFFHRELGSIKEISFAPLFQSTTNPIYLSVCNFRI